jgi:hypothetical protein
MVALRPPPTRSGQWIRLAMTGLIALHVALSAWMVIQFDGAYTEGRPAPSEIHALIAVDKDHTLIDVKIEKATALFLYSMSRDESASPKSNEGSNTTDDEKEESSSEEKVDYLNFTRNSTLVLLAFLVICEVLMMFRIRHVSWLRVFTWATVMLCFVLFLPIAYFSSLGGIGGADYGGDRNNDAMVHMEDSFGFHVIPLGLVIDYDFSGYDLGLVDPENRSAVIDSPPVAGSEEAKSWIAFESTFSIATGKNVMSLLFLPFVWFFIPANPTDSAESTDDETGEETAKDYSIGDEESE